MNIKKKKKSGPNIKKHTHNMEFWAKLALTRLLLKLICKLAYLDPHQPKIFFFLIYFTLHLYLS